MYLLTQSDLSLGWSTYVYPTDWQAGINRAIEYPLINLSPPFEVPNKNLAVGDYTFYFAVDDNADNTPDATWWDSVEVHLK